MKQRFKILFFLKKGRLKNPVSIPIYVRITVDGQRVEWSVQRSCEQTRWNKVTGRALGGKKEFLELNSYLDTIQGNIFEIQKEYALRNELLNAETIRNRLLKKSSDNSHTLIEVYQYHNDQFGKLVGAQYSNGTFKKFKSALFSIEKFIQWKFNKKDVLLSEVNHKFITDYEFYLKYIQGMQHNSSMGNLKKLKKIVRQCVANDWMEKDPFRSYKITSQETHRNFLSMDELNLLVAKKIIIERLGLVRDIFVFSCYTGLSYSDVVSLSPQDICVGIDGEKWIFIKRTKTNTDSRIPLLPVALNILSKYENHPRTVANNKLLPTLSNNRLNSYLKEIADICQFNKELTFHCARHTFATTVTLTNGVPIETVGKMLGHKSLRTTQLYAKILDNKVSEDMKHLKNRLKDNVQEIKTKTNQNDGI